MRTTTCLPGEKKSAEKVISLKAFKRKKDKAERERREAKKDDDDTAKGLYCMGVEFIKQSMKEGESSLYDVDTRFTVAKLDMLKLKLTLLSQQRPENIWMVNKLVGSLFPIFSEDDEY
jgi:hypothetical protein